MELQTKQSNNETRWVINKIQTSRALNTRGGRLGVIYYYEHRDGEPSIRNQGLIIQRLCDCGAIEILKKSYDHLQSLKTGKKVELPESFDIQTHTNNEILPSSIVIKIIEDKFEELLLSYEIDTDEDSITYYFNKDKAEGRFKVGEKFITFRKGTGYLIQYFYENRNKKNIGLDFETYREYLGKYNYNIKIPDNKEFRVSINGINSRIKKEFENLNSIITITNPDKGKGRNRYKWKIEFEEI